MALASGPLPPYSGGSPRQFPGPLLPVVLPAGPSPTLTGADTSQLAAMAPFASATSASTMATAPPPASADVSPVLPSAAWPSAPVPGSSAPAGAPFATRPPVAGTPSNPVKVACLECRRLKQRCHEREGSATCQRCTKYGLLCEYKEHARGPKRRKTSPTPVEGSTSSTAGPSPGQRAAAQLSTSPNASAPFLDGATVRADTPTSALRSTTHVLSDLVSAISEPPAPAWSLAGLLGGKKDGAGAPPSYDQFPDPVALGIVTEDEVDRLWVRFVNELNPFIAVLDPKLHTPVYVRSRSSLLFTSILAVATKYWEPEVHGQCLKLAQDHLAQVLVMPKRRKWTNTIQAMCLLSFWKEAADEGGWRRIGFAIRLAYEEGLHKRARLSPGDLGRMQPQDAMEVLDRDRTWLYLMCMDQALSFQRDLPCMIAREHVFDGAVWATETAPYTVAEDGWLPAVLEYSSLRHQTRGVRMLSSQLSNDAMSSSTTYDVRGELFRCTRMLETVRVNFEGWKGHWLAPNCVPRHSERSHLMLRFYAAFMSFYIASTGFDHVQQSQAILLPPPAEREHAERAAFTSCFEDALAVLAMISTLAQDTKHALIYLPDTVPVGATSAAAWLVKHLPLQDTASTAQVSQALSRASADCKSASIHPKDPPRYLSTFFSALAQLVEEQQAAHLDALLSASEPPLPGRANSSQAMVQQMAAGVMGQPWDILPPVPQDMNGTSTSMAFWGSIEPRLETEGIWTWLQNGQLEQTWSMDYRHI